MAPTQNKTLIFKKIPTAVPVPGEHLVVEDRPLDLSNVPNGGLVVQILSASFDPYLRGKMRDPSIKSYSPAFELDAPITNSVVAKVVASDVPDYQKGELVVGYLPIAEYAAVAKEQLGGVRKINNKHGLKDLGLFLGPLGMPGLTAYSGLHAICKPKKGETIFISSAAGAVGQVVGQVAKREGLTVIGSVGSDDKLEFITKELGFDAGFNYKKEAPGDALKRLAPNGIDIYFENVGGEHLAAALDAMNLRGRIAVCGMISGYNQAPEDRYGVKNLMYLVSKRILMQGFLVGDEDFGPKYREEHQENVGKWLAEGSIKAKLSVTEGIDHAAEGLVGMLEGKNFGKAILKIRDP